MDQCIYCGQNLDDDGVLLIADDGSDICDDQPNRFRFHCTGFVPDSAGDNPEVCIQCLAHRLDHPTNK